MRSSRYSDSQILAILKQNEQGVPVADLCREHGMSSALFYKWRAKFGGMDASMMKRLKELELIDDIVREPLGSAYRDIDTTARNIKQALVSALESTEKVGLDKLLDQRYERLMSYGNFIKEEAS